MSVITTVTIKTVNSFDFKKIPGLDPKTGRVRLDEFLTSELVKSKIYPSQAYKNHIAKASDETEKNRYTFNYLFGIEPSHANGDSLPSYFNSNGDFTISGNYAPHIADFVLTLAELYPNIEFIFRETYEGSYVAIGKACYTDKLEKIYTPLVYDVQDPNPDPIEHTRNEKVLIEQYNQIFK